MRKAMDQVLLTHLLPEILQRRLIRLNGLCDAFPILIKDVITRLSGLSRRSSKQELKTLTVGVCTVFGSTSIRALYFAVRPNDSQIAAQENYGCNGECLAVPLGMKDRDLIQRLLAMGVSPISKRSLFGNTLDFAAEHGGMDILRFFLGAITPATTHQEKRGRKNATANLITTKLGENDEDVALELLDFFLSSHAPPIPHNAASWMEKAVEASVWRFTDRLIGHHFAVNVQAGICRGVLNSLTYPDGSGDLIHTLLQKGIINTTIVNTQPYLLDARGEVMCLQDLAVTLRDIELVKQLHDLGAKPDGVSRDYFNWSGPRATFILRLVVNSACADIVDLLLERGADPQFGRTHNLGGRRRRREGLCSKWQIGLGNHLGLCRQRFRYYRGTIRDQGRIVGQLQRKSIGT
jgi:hypothetical protein